MVDRNVVDDLATGYPELASILLTGLCARESDGVADSAFRLLLLGDSDPTPEALSACDAPAERRHQSTAVAVLIPIEELPPANRIARLLGLRLLLWHARRRLIKLGCTPRDAFCVSPSLHRPVFVYSMRPSSARYARANLLSRQSGPKALAKALVSWIAGCDASTAGIVVLASIA